MPNYNSYDNDGSSRRASRGTRRSSSAQSTRASRQQRSGRARSSQGRRGSRDALRSNRNYRTINGTDTGLNLRQRSINFGAAGNRSNRTTLVLLGVAVVLLVLLVFGISSCVRGCAARRGSGGSDDGTNTQDSRVAVGATPDITSRLTPALDSAEGIERIAANADKYDDVRMIDLAVTVPEAVNFVGNYPSADHTSATFNDTITAGTFPQLYDWDSRWGYTDYADGAFGVTGSGPTVLAMAYMGLTGSAEQTPYSMGQAVTAANFASGEAGMDKGFFENTQLSKVGMSANSYSSTTDDLAIALSGGTPAAVLVRAGTLTNYAHWILVTGYADDGSVMVNDPTSTSVSSHTWSAGTIVSSADGIFACSAASSSSDDSQEATVDDYDTEDDEY